MRRLLRRLSLRARLLLLTATLLLVGLGLVGTAVSVHLQRYQVDRLDSQLRSLASILAAAPIAESTEPDPMADPALLDPALDLFGTPYMAFVNSDGTIVRDIHSSGLDQATLPRRADLQNAPTDGSPVNLQAADGSGRWRVIARSSDGWDGTVIVAAPLSQVDATVTQIRASSLISGGVLLVVLTAFGWLALRQGLRPLRRIESTAAAIAEGDLTQRVPELAAPGTEVGRLARSLNTMLGQLEWAFAERAASEARMRTFVADVSHELRTPIFGITGTTELYRMGALPDRADVDEAITTIDREAARLAALTEDLLLLARLDEAPEGQLDQNPMDLRTLAVQAQHDLRAMTPPRPVELSGPDGHGSPGPAPVNADENRLYQVVTNLVNNAVSHTPPGTRVRLGVGTVNGRAVLDVADDGPGMTAQQAERVFDRFYQVDRSRNRDGGASAGLGLAIARSLARAHGGDVELTTSLGDGACFRLTLPVLRQEHDPHAGP